MAGPMGDEDAEKERRLFRDAMRGVRPLDAPPPPPPSPPPPRPRRTPRSDARVDTGTDAVGRGLDGDRSQSAPPAERGERFEYRAPGIQRSVLRRLVRGQPPVEGSLDLHGLTAAKATETMRAFLAEAQSVGARCVRIVHGKGLGSGDRGPVLKSLVNAWLREQPQVLAFVSAPPEDGGTGATWVLLSRPPRDEPRGR